MWISEKKLTKQIEEQMTRSLFYGITYAYFQYHEGMSQEAKDMFITESVHIIKAMSPEDIEKIPKEKLNEYGHTICIKSINNLKSIFGK